MAQNEKNGKKAGFFRSLFEKKHAAADEESAVQEVVVEEQRADEEAAKKEAATINVGEGTMLELWHRWTQRKDPLVLSLFGDGHGSAVPLTERELAVERVRLIAKIERDTKEFLRAMNHYEEKKLRIEAKRALAVAEGKEFKEEPDDNLVDVKTFCRIYLSANSVVAWMLLIPPSDPNDLLPIEAIREALAENKVIHGIDNDTIEYISKEHPYFTLIPVACGTPVQEGENGRVIEHYPRQLNKSVKLDERGVADYRAMNYMQNIKEGDVICDIIPPKPGVAGVRVDGSVLEPAAAKLAVVPAGPNTAISEDGTKLLAAKEGHLEFDGSKFCVKVLLDIPSDVDYNTGNIDYNGDIRIHGDVRETFVVKATGNITIDGLVEAATVEAGGDVLISCGVHGDNKAVIKSGGNLRAKYLDNCVAYAGKSVFADSIIASQVYSDESIQVNSGRGVIIGGSLVAANSIKAKIVGTESGRKTELELGTLSYVKIERGSDSAELKEALAELANLERDIEFLQKKHKNQERQAEGNEEAHEDPRLAAALLRKTAVCAHVEELTERQRELEEMKPDLAKCRFECGTVHPPAMLTIGGAIWKFEEIKNNCAAWLDKETGEVKIS